MSSAVVPSAAAARPTVRERVAHERSRLRLVMLLGAAGVAVGMAALVLALGAATLAGGRWIRLPGVVPFLIWGLVLLAVAGVAVAARRLVRRTLAEPALARAVETERSLRDGALRGVLEVSGSGPLARRAEERLAASLGAPGAPLAPAWRRRLARQGAIAAGGGALALLGLAVVAAWADDGWAALVHPARAWSGTLLPRLAIVELPPGVMRGEPLTVSVHAPGRRTVTVRHRATGGAWQATRLPVEGDRAQLALERLDADLAVLATDGRATSDTALVRVTDRPFLGDVSIRATFPSYLNRAAETLPLGEPARVPRGTELRIEGGSSTTLRTVALASGADTLRFVVDGRRFAGRVVAERSGRYEWSALGATGLVPDVPEPFQLDVVQDGAPLVAIRVPSRDTAVLANDRVRLALDASDDHGLGDVVVRSWRRRADGGLDPETTLRLAGEGRAQWSGAAELDLSTRRLEAGDELRVVVTAVDLSPWRQTGMSRELILRVPAIWEQRANVRAAADSAVARAAATAGAQASLAQRTSDAARARDRSGSARDAGQSGGGGGGSAMSYESAERAQALASEQRQLAEQVEQMRETARSLERQLDQAGALDEELQSRLRDAQRLMQEAMTPAMQEQLRKLEESSQRLSPEETRQALGDLAAQQQRLREQLEKSAEMLRRAALEGAMETLRDEAQELAEAQKRHADSLGGQRAPSPPAGEQQRQAQAQRDSTGKGGEQRGEGGQQQRASGGDELARRTEQLARDVEKLQERLARENAAAGATRTQEAANHSDASAERMREAAAQQRGERVQSGGERGERREQASSEPSAQQRASGEQPSAQQGAQQQSAQQQAAQQQGAQQQGAQQQGAQQQGAQQQGAQSGGMRMGGQQGGSQQGGQQAGAQQGGQRGADAAREAASEMQQAAERLGQARSEQVGEWKQELTSELDRSINELMQLAREQGRLEQQARQGEGGDDVRAQQAAVQQGVQRTGQRLQEQSRSTTLLSQRSQQAMTQAQQEVQQAAQQATQQQGGQQGGQRGSAGGQQTADAMRQAAEALNQAAASLVRDRARANASQSATGFAEMMEEMQQLAQQQGSVNAQAAGLMPGQGRSQAAAEAAARARQLAQEQRAIARRLDDMSDNDRSGRTDAMAEEARRLAQALEGGVVDANTTNRQQRLFRRMLDAGRTLQQEERDESGRREGETARTGDAFVPAEADVGGRSARRFELPTWNELRGLSPEERRLVIEYFRRLNGEGAAPAPTSPAPSPER